VETLADLIQESWLDLEDVNEILGQHGSSVSFDRHYADEAVRVEVLAVDEIEADEEDEQPNIRVLVRRMESALEQDDHAAVLHSSASIFETLAKDIVAIESIQDQTLASFFDRYKKDSQLPEPVLDYILDVYKKRNVEPLAGHGQLTPPTVSKDEAVVLSEMTKAFVRIERQLSNAHVSMTKSEES